MPDEAKIAAVRAALPATGAGIYLNAGSVGPLPAETARAMSEVADRELQVGRASYADYLDTLDRRAEARAAVAAILSADIDTVALTHSTTDGLNIAATGHDWRPGDRAVTTNREHVGGVAPLLALAESRGVEVELVNVGVGADEAAILAAFDRAIDERTRVVSFSHVLWSTGAVMPVRAIADLAHERGAFVLVDGAQAPGAIAVDVAALGVDAYALSAQKWLLGPEGMGALWVSPEWNDRIRPTFAGWFGFDSPGDRPPYRRFADARRHEIGTLHGPSIVGFARSCGWLAMYVGLEWAHSRAAGLAGRFADALAATPRVELVTPRDRMATLLTSRIEGWPGDRVLEELGRRTFAIARTVPDSDWVRFSVGFWNTEAELDRVAATMGELAAHTPETMPARPSLTIVGEGA
jgi:L-cysteine/cystine lyase